MARRRYPPGTRRSPRHERLSLVVEINALGDDRRFVSVADYRLPIDETIVVDIPIQVDDEDTGPRTQVLYLAVPPRLPARKS